MPYIKQEDRARVLQTLLPANSGELNFLLTTIILEYVGKPSYAKINDVLGALEGAKLEFYRRTVVPYENFKITENGDIG